MNTIIEKHNVGKNKLIITSDAEMQRNQEIITWEMPSVQYGGEDCIGIIGIEKSITTKFEDIKQ